AGNCCSTGATPGEAAAPETVKDPVCGMDVDPAKTQHHAPHGGTEYHFCSGGCRTKFVADPERYLSEHPRPEPVAAPGAM
ncbi:YHS domain-containing protein, partial [Acinetobacter baumannii]